MLYVVPKKVVESVRVSEKSRRGRFEWMRCQRGGFGAKGILICFKVD